MFDLIKLIIGSILFALSFIFKNQVNINHMLVIISYLILGYEVILNAFKNIFHGEFLDENFLMSIATIGAFILGSYSEAVMVMLLYSIGEFLEDSISEKSRKNIEKLISSEPKVAHLVKDDKELDVNPSNLQTGDIIKVLPGEAFSVDCTLLDSSIYIDNRAITGESIPENISIGKTILSGAILLDKPCYAKVLHSFQDSTYHKIITLVEESQEKKAKTERFITNFARIYTPIVCILAILIAIIPSLITKAWRTWIYRALTFLVISCPCALVLSVPLAFFAAIGLCAHKGILVKGGIAIENLAKTTLFAFDKTGTITSGKFEVSNIHGNKECLSYAFSLEKNSNHPIALSIKDFCIKNNVPVFDAFDVKEETSLGLSGTVNGKTVHIGNEKMMGKYDIKYIPISDVYSSLIYVSYDNEYIGCIVVNDKIKEEAKEVVSSLKDFGIKENVMLSGDRLDSVKYVSDYVGLSSYYSSLLPDEKLEHLKSFQKDNICSYVGDGINDAPVLALADVGFSMGSLGSDIAIEASSVVITTDDLRKIPLALKISKKAVRIAKENVALALFVKFLCLLLSFFGITNMALAVFADTGVALVAIFNSLRALRNN